MSVSRFMTSTRTKSTRRDLRAKPILLARQSGTRCIDSCDEIAIKQPGVFGSFQVESGIRASTYAPRDLFDRLLSPIRDPR